MPPVRNTVTREDLLGFYTLAQHTRIAPAMDHASETAATGEACNVCRDDEWDLDAPIVLCDGPCGRAAHTSCVGLLAVPEGDWLCDSCAAGGMDSRACQLCGRRGGMMKRVMRGSSAGSWCHVTCALSFEQARFDSSARLDGLSLAALAPALEAGRRAPCTVCSSRLGAKVRCVAGDCRAYLHPSCAADAGLRFELLSSDRPSAMYCAAHQAQWPASGTRADGFRWNEIAGLFDGEGVCHRVRAGEEGGVGAPGGAAARGACAAAAPSAGAPSHAGNSQLYGGRLINCATVGKVRGAEGAALRRAVLPEELRAASDRQVSAGARA